MKYSAKRIDLTIGREFAPPAFHLPSRTPEVFERLFLLLNPRFALSLEDTKSLGGTSYGDVKLVLTAFGGAGQFEATPGGFSCHFVNLIRTEDDVRTIFDFTETCEKAMQEIVKESDIRNRTFRARLWLDCEGGLPAVEQLLLESGSRALNLEIGPFLPLRKKFTIRADMSDPTEALKMNIMVQRSEVEGFHMFVECGFFYASTHAVQTLREQFEHGRGLLMAALSQLGMEAAS